MGGGLDLCHASERVFQEASDSCWPQNSITFILVYMVAKAHILIQVCHTWPLGASVETWRSHGVAEMGPIAPITD